MTSLASILSEHPELTLLPNNRIKCAVTNHEVPPNVAAVLSHINGKKYKKALEWYNKDFSKYLPYITAHKSDSTKLYCNVTKQELNKIPEQVQKHVAGKRFQRLKEEYHLQEMKKKKKGSAAKKEAESEEDDEEPDFWSPEGIDDDEDDQIQEDEEDEDDTSASEEDEEEEESYVEERPPEKLLKNKNNSSKYNAATKGSNKRKREEKDDLVIIRKAGGKKGK